MRAARSTVPALLRFGAAVGLLAAATRVAAVDLTGSYAGQLVVVGAAPATVDAAGALTQTGRTLSGTLVLGTTDPSLGGAYLVNGKIARKRLRLVGQSPSGARLVWRGAANANGAVGPAKVRVAGVPHRGRLTLTRNPSGTDGSSCDAVFTQNQALFTDQIMGQVLVPVCASCHVAGGQAQATRLRVVRDDALATARSVALLVDPADAAASLIVRKPIAAVPHGGGAPLTAGSPQEQLLMQWADLVVQAQCAASIPVASLFVQDCAGCHGTDGAGSATAPDVRCTARTLLADAVRRGRGQAMPASELSDAEVATLAAYLHERCSGRPKDLYAANCATCHGPTAGGGRNADGVSGPNIRCGGENLVEAVRRGAEGMPAFPSFTDAQIAGLGRYLHNLCSLGGGGDD